MKFLQTLLEELKGQKAKRGEFLVKTYGPKWEGVQGYDSIEQFVEYLAEIDPSQKGIYMQWIMKNVMKNPNENKVEDLPRLAQDLRNFEEYKAKLPKKDINQYKNFYDVFAAVDAVANRKLTPAEKRKANQAKKLEKAKEGIEDVYKGPEGWIKIPTTKAAACFLGQSTRWCTAARSGNMYDHYDKDDRLFVIYDKESQDRFQLHIATGQFSDVTDKMLGIDAVPEWARKPIIKWYKKNRPDLNMKHITTFAKFGDTDIAKGTPHEELVDLMKKYGVA